MKILIFGGNRFIGKELVKKEIEYGHDITVANRTGLPDELSNFCKSIICDRCDKESMEFKIGKQYFDIVYDMICYSGKNAIEIMDSISTNKYIMISSGVVYGWGRNFKESDFIAEKYPAELADINELGRKYGYKQGYRIGKMSAESLISNCDRFETLRIRFPLVIGKNDHTKRIESYIDAISNQKPLFVDNLYSQVSVVEKKNAAEYLVNIQNDPKISNVINVGDWGSITIKELVNLIEQIYGKELIYSENGTRGGITASTIMC